MCGVGWLRGWLAFQNSLSGFFCPAQLLQQLKLFHLQGSPCAPALASPPVLRCSHYNLVGFCVGTASKTLLFVLRTKPKRSRRVCSHIIHQIITFSSSGALLGETEAQHAVCRAGRIAANKIRANTQPCCQPVLWQAAYRWVCRCGRLPRVHAAPFSHFLSTTSLIAGMAFPCPVSHMQGTSGLLRCSVAALSVLGGGQLPWSASRAAHNNSSSDGQATSLWSGLSKALLHHAAAMDSAGSDEENTSSSNKYNVGSSRQQQGGPRGGTVWAANSSDQQRSHHQQQHVGQLHNLAGPHSQQLQAPAAHPQQQPRYEGHLHAPHGRRHATSRSQVDRFISEQVSCCLGSCCCCVWDGQQVINNHCMRTH